MSGDSALSLLDFGGGQRLPMIRQTEASECGLACLAMIASFHGYRTDMGSLRRQFSISLKGVNLQTLIAIGDRMNLSSRPLKVEMEALDKVKMPAILHWDFKHFVVLKKVTTRGIVVHDPAIGIRRYPWAEVSKHYTGVAVEIEPADGFQQAEQRSRLRLSQLWSRLIGLRRALLQLLGLSVILQLFVLLSPFYTQLVIDEVLTKFDVELLGVLAIGFGLFALIYVITNALRSHLVLYVGGMMSYQMMINIFRHLLRLPQSYFDKRHIGDIVSRFSSTMPIKKMLTEGLVAAFIDGVMALTTLVLMYVYSPLLAGITLIALLIIITVRLMLFRLFRRRTEEAILSKAREYTSFIESVRGILSIKLFGRESQRQQVWQNRLAEVINADVRVGKTRITFDVTNKLLIGLETIAVVYFAALLVLNSSFTVGMLFAFIAYKTVFTEKALALVDFMLDYRLLDLHLERLSDIALTEPEWRDDTAQEAPQIKGALELRNVSFRYADFEPVIFDNLSLKIAPGESLAITGPSGCGKTTLVKLILGLLTPQSGEVLVDGISLKRFGLHAYREQVAAVMQEDRLFAGSIADNIAFFDPEASLDWIKECAKAAAIHEEIKAMPMGYDTLIGDMGTVLSGGQKQRVMLARALYRRPRILIMDEGTAHLDLAAEKTVNESVAAMGITRIIIAHRPETVARADRVLVMQPGGEMAERPSTRAADMGTTPTSPRGIA